MDWLDVKSVAGREGSVPRGVPAPDEAGEPPGLADPAAREELLARLVGGLNEPQRAACEHDRGPLLILAGPGSGKTRVITHRVVHLLVSGRARPHEVLAITFTNKAAGEMRERVARMLPELRGPWISTFHALCARILRRDIEALPGYTRDFSIYDTGDRNQLLKRLIKDLGYDPKRFRPGVLGGWISNLKNKAVEEDGGYSGSASSGGDAGMEHEVLVRVRRAYEERMREQNALDFDDLLLKVLELFHCQPGIRDAYARRFRYVMVDEYQDTNRAQYLLARHLAGEHGNIAVCGDPDQSIYGWRGADLRNILYFEDDFGAPTVVRLEQNYRSTGNILAAADALIANNRARKEKGLWTEDPPGERLVVLECGDENDEAREIALQVLGHVAAGGSPGNCAVFYRANFMQRALETALTHAKLPYQVVSGLEFYQRREIRDLVAYLRLLVNPADDVAFRRVVNVPGRGVGETSLARLAECSAERGLPLLAACRSEEGLARIRGRARKGLAAFAGLLDELAPLRDADAATALELLLQGIDVDRWLGEMDDGTGAADREANVQELVGHAREYDRLDSGGKLRGFLQEVALVSETDDLSEGVERVTLMTLHACKGLEYPLVFIAGVEEELLPHARSLAEAAESGGDPDAALEEERRLLYVGMTRARERLFLSHAATRLVFGETRWTRPSRFLDEIPPELLEGREPEAEEAEALGVYEPQQGGLELVVGERVEHDHFGPGRVERLSGSGVNARAVVAFVHHGAKELLLQYAKLRRID